MKKIFILSAAAGVMCALPAMAVQKCVVSSPSSCASLLTLGASLYNRADWSATCKEFGIQGVAMCSSTSGTTMGQTAAKLDVTSTLGANRYCWCKMVSPAVSNWVYCSNYAASSGNCEKNCAYDCEKYVDSVTFKAALFSSLSD